MANPNSQTAEKVNVIVRKQTWLRIEQLSKVMNTTIDDVLDTLVWLGTKSSGRVVKVEENKRQMSISFEKYPKAAPLDV